MGKSFNEVYNEVFSKYSEEVKQVQASSKKMAIVAIVLYCILLLLLVLSKAYYIIFQFSIFYLIISSIVINLFSKNKKGNTYKTGVINDLVKAIYPAAEYTYNRRYSL